jgi:hypothetical protein
MIYLIILFKFNSIVCLFITRMGVSTEYVFIIVYFKAYECVFRGVGRLKIFFAYVLNERLLTVFKNPISNLLKFYQICICIYLRTTGYVIPIVKSSVNWFVLITMPNKTWQQFFRSISKWFVEPKVNERIVTKNRWKYNKMQNLFFFKMRLNFKLKYSKIVRAFCCWAQASIILRINSFC